jgi:molybdenum cofactor synthesis domain-containing protein
MKASTIPRQLRAGVLTVSDRSFRGEREDKAGPAIEKLLSASHFEVTQVEVCPDEKGLISELLMKWSDVEGFDLIVTTGGTGVAPRDVTPEATEAVCHRLVPGMAEVMRSESLKKTPNAMISRAVAGIRNQTLIINLPGSPKGAIENLEAVMPALRHAMDKIQGDPTDCA